MLAVHNLSFLDYGPFSFSISAGSGISIRGGSGTGKSLLLRAIADLDEHSGDIRLEEQSQDAIDAHDWRRQIGYLMAESFFWEETVGMHFPELESAFLQQTADVLQVTALFDRTINKLSSGEKQRIALLRLLANQPSALLLDEPTSHLDPDMQEVAEQVILDYQGQHHCPLLLVSHDDAQCQRLTSRHYLMQNKNLQEIRQ